MAERLADDYAEIAQRMRELAAERGDMQTATERPLLVQHCPVYANSVTTFIECHDRKQGDNT